MNPEAQDQNQPRVFFSADCYRRLLLGEQAARKQAEAEKRAYEEFLAVLSHELRNSLNAMQVWTRLLRAQKLEEGKLSQTVSMIECSVKSQTKLVDELLDFSRIINGKLRLDFRSR